MHCCEDLFRVLLLIPFYTKEFQHVELDFVTEVQTTLYSSSSTVPCTVARIYPAFFCSSLFTLQHSHDIDHHHDDENYLDTIGSDAYNDENDNDVYDDDDHNDDVEQSSHQIG